MFLSSSHEHELQLNLTFYEFRKVFEIDLPLGQTFLIFLK